MKASELRIGNLLEFSNGIQPTKTVTVGRRFFSSASIETEDGDFEITGYYKPIPLTEDWLEKFGFEKYEFLKNRFRYKKGVFEFRRGVDLLMMGRHGKAMRWASCIGLFSYHYEYVHQLQNLYFAITGEELTTKN
jgi:hypothetical protein